MSAIIKFLAGAACISAFVGCQTGPGGAPSAVKYMPANGARLPYVEQGQGTPVVFVHGAVSDHRTWERQREAVSTRYRAIAYTQRYFGTEPWDKNGPKFGVQTHADDLVAFIRGLNAGPVHLVAWSYGGHIVLNVALKNPELVKSAFVFEPAVPSYVTDTEQLKALADDARALFGPIAQAVQAGDNAAAVRRLIDGVGGREGYFAAQPASAQGIQMDSAGSMALIQSNQAPPPLISCAQLGEIKPSVAIVRGELARPFFKTIADAAARCIPTGRHVIAPKANHMWPSEDPQGFSQALMGFLKDK